MKQEFKKGINLVLGFWPGEAHGMFTTPSLSLMNGWLWVALLMFQGQHCLHFTVSNIQGCENTTFKIINLEHAWQCKKKLGWHLTFLSNGWFFSTNLFRGGFQENWHLFIIDGHGSHITIQTLEQVIEVGL